MPLVKVISAGAGGNIDFEVALCNRGSYVELYDPSPIGIYTASISRHERLSFFPYGLSAHSGQQGFDLPEDNMEMSYRPGSTLQFSCIGIREAVGSYCDLLKMNIEGFEYEIIREICKHNLDIRAINVSFHDKWQGIPTWRTVSAVASLLFAGYKIIAKKRSEYCFMKRQSNA